MDLKKSIGVGAVNTPEETAKLIKYINLKLAAMGQPTVRQQTDGELVELVSAFLLHHRETDRLLGDYLCPADWRIQSFLNDYLYDCQPVPRLQSNTFVLDRHGIARMLSLPPDRDEFVSDIVSSYRVRQGVLHNPASDRRTTQGVFHIAEGGLPVPADKLEVPRATYTALLRLALNPPPEISRLPFTSSQAEQAECFVSLLLRPVVCPEVPGFTAQRTMEVRFFAPGNLVGNLDFVESIFGNAGDPYLPENDAGLDIDHWTGHTGCVILAPHLVFAKKKDLGLPHWDRATERQRRDGMCWKQEDERYNGGSAFKVTARDERGVMVTIIADNYFGYCKKEVKTQISYAANLLGSCEEEHGGGAIAYPSFDLGEEFSGMAHVANRGHSFREAMEMFGAIMDLQPEGYGIDKKHPNILYVPEDVVFDLHRQTASWSHPAGEKSIKLLPDKIYVRPSGYKVRMEKPTGGRAWRLVGTVAEGTLCHKPCTVSGGGKSEISKSISDAIIQGPVYVADFQRDFDRVAALLTRDYSGRFRDPAHQKPDHRAILDHERSLGSVIKMLTPSPAEFSDEYNAWLATIPQRDKELVFVLKRFYKPEWGEHWREHFSVNIIDGTLGNELHCDGRKLVTNFLRVGYDADGTQRVFRLRKDFHPAVKLQTEDDITASIVVPGKDGLSQKFVHNCEYRLFQRPDDAIHPGYDKQTELDFSQPGNFFSNYEPLSAAQARELMEDSINFIKFTEPMQRRIRDACAGKSWFVCSARPRMVDGKPSKNPRYLQNRPGLLDDRERYLAEIGMRFQRRLPLDQPVLTPVDVVVPGRRNNASEHSAGIRSLAVFNPIHYMELPELFMEFISSMTGKSPSTTGAGSEGALTKGPFNALPPIIDLNNALVAWILTGHEGFISSAGCVGPKARVDHDISLLIPELWSRMSAEERDPRNLIRIGALEKCENVEFEGRKLLASRLGYRITAKFVHAYFGRVFHHPHAVFTPEMLRPELQDRAEFAEGIDNIAATHQRVARLYFEDGGVEVACPPLRALLHIMRDNEFEGKGLEHPEIRALFTRENLLASAWYTERLATKQAVDTQLWLRHHRYLEKFLTRTNYALESERLQIGERLARVKTMLERIRSADYQRDLIGTIGAQPLDKLVRH